MSCPLKSESHDAIWERLAAAMELAAETGQPQVLSVTHVIDGEHKTITLKVVEVVSN
jgi:hypothetical protein